jgi:type IV pilus assembly protein PilY1
LNAGSDLSLTARINGGVIADLQLVDDTDTESNTNNRRLYYPPDVSISQPDDSEAPSLFISVGSGFRAHPLNGTIIDHFFVLKFPDIFQNTDFDTLEPLYIGDLLDISNLNFAADPPPVITETEGVNLKNNGWYIVFPDDGEKSLSESITAAGIVIFTTYTPPANDELPADQQSCTGNQGTGKIYAVSIVDGRPVANLDGIGAVNDLTLSDRSYATKAAGIPPRPKIIFPDFDNVSGKLIVGREIVPLNIPSTPELAYWFQQGVR